MKRTRTLIGLTALAAALASTLPAEAVAATRLFTVITNTGKICEIDPVTGGEIFCIQTPGTGVHVGLAFNGTELFYTDNTLPGVKVYLPDGTFVRDLPKPGAGEAAGAGLGVSATSLYGIGIGDETITAIDPVTGALQSSFYLGSTAKVALTFAGRRSSIFVRAGDANQILEVALDGTILHTITGPVTFGGLAYSSTSDILFGTVDGKLYAMDPDTGALLPGYPVMITDGDGNPYQFTGGAAADEPMLGECGDGTVDPGEQCDDGNRRRGDGCDGECRLTSRVTRSASFWKERPTLIDGSFDGAGGRQSLLGFEFCGKTVSSACDAVKLLASSGSAQNNFKRQAVAAILNCREFNNCPRAMELVVHEGSEACAKRRSFPYGIASIVLELFNASGSRHPLPFTPPAPTPGICR